MTGLRRDVMSFRVHVKLHYRIVSHRMVYESLTR